MQSRFQALESSPEGPAVPTSCKTIERISDHLMLSNTIGWKGGSVELDFDITEEAQAELEDASLTRYYKH